jgi:hypothetical protein
VQRRIHRCQAGTGPDRGHPIGARRSPVAVAYITAPTTSGTERLSTTSRGRTSW